MGASSARLGLPYPVGSDTDNPPADFARLATALDSVAVVFAEGPAAARPPFGVDGRIYSATDSGAIYYDYGSGWTQLNFDAALATVQSKGDLIVGLGAGSVDNLPVGADGQTLQAASGSPMGMQWGNVQGSPVGLPGALRPARFVGGTSAGPPLSGTFNQGDFVVDLTGDMWVCYQASRVLDGTDPGRWRGTHEPALGQPVNSAGAGAATRFVGGTSSGPPSQGTFFVGDFVIDQSAAVWVCIAGGTPGTWVGLVKHACYTAFQSVIQELLVGLWMDLQFDTVAIDTDDGHYPTGRGSFYTCRRRGTYRLHGSLCVGGINISGAGIGCRLTFNGDPIIGTANFDPVITLGYNTPAAHPAQIELEVGDVVGVQGFHPAPSSVFTVVSQADVRCRFTVEQLR